MKSNMILSTLMIVFLGLTACAKPKAEKKEPQADPGNVITKVAMPPIMLQVFYRLPGQHAALKKALEPVTGPAIGFVWPHVESVQSLSVWVFEPPVSTPGKFTPPRFVTCIKGKATDWLYLAQLQSPEGKPIEFVKDSMQRIRGPEGSHPVYYLQDRGQFACLGSTEALASDAFGWPDPALPAGGFAMVHGHVPSLFSLSGQQDFTTAVDSLMALSGVTQQQMAKVRELFASLEDITLTFDLSPGLEWLSRLDLVWKQTPEFFHTPKKSRIPFSEHTLADLHLEFRDGRWMGIELWPLFEKETGLDLREQVKKFINDLQAIDFQLVRQDEGRLAARVVIDAPSQDEFLHGRMGELMKKLPEKDKFSVKSLPASPEVSVWEAAPTAAEDADVRSVVNQFFGGAVRVESSRSPGAIVWTFGQWPESGAPVAMPDDNQRAVWAMLPFFNMALPIIEEQDKSPQPRYTPYPTVPQDPWRISARFDTSKKALQLEGSMPLGAWLTSFKVHPELLKRMQNLNKPAPPATAPPSDL